MQGDQEPGLSWTIPWVGIPSTQSERRGDAESEPVASELAPSPDASRARFTARTNPQSTPGEPRPRYISATVK